MIPLTTCALLIANWFCAACLTGTCEIGPRAEAPKPPSPRQSAPYTITLSMGSRAVIPEEALTVELMGVKDNRCAVEVQCVWAGYAEVTLRVSKTGAAPESLVVGALAPSPNGAPAQPTYDSYRFSLLGVEPDNSMAKPVAQSQYRATIKVSRLQ
jgi:hypothetical protein